MDLFYFQNKTKHKLAAEGGRYKCSKYFLLLLGHKNSGFLVAEGAPK